MVGSAMQSSTISNATSSSNEVVSGNYSLGNTSIGNDSLYNSSKFNISEYNRSNNNNSSDNTTIGNTSLNNFSRDTISEDVSSRNIHNANKIDTSKNIVNGKTETYTIKGIATFTFGDDGKLAAIQEEKSSIANSVSVSRGVSESEGERVDKGHGGGLSVGLSAGTAPKDNTVTFKSKALDKIADFTGINFNAGGGYNINNTNSKETTNSSGTQMVNDQVYTQQTIDHLNSKYDKEYMKNNMDSVLKEANEFQAGLSGTKEVNSTESLYTKGKGAVSERIDLIKDKIKK